MATLGQNNPDNTGDFGCYNSSTAGNAHWTTYRSTSTSTNTLFTGHSDVGGTEAQVIFINANGDLTHNNSRGTISDINRKQDITDAHSQIDDIKAVRIVNYRLKSEVATNPDAPTKIGVIAQELEQICPYLVVDDEYGDNKSVKYSILYMKAMKALQEVMERIEVLEQEIAEYKATNTNS